MRKKNHEKKHNFNKSCVLFNGLWSKFETYLKWLNFYIYKLFHNFSNLYKSLKLDTNLVNNIHCVMLKYHIKENLIRNISFLYMSENKIFDFRNISFLKWNNLFYWCLNFERLYKFFLFSFFIAFRYCKFYFVVNFKIILDLKKKNL